MPVTPIANPTPTTVSAGAGYSATYLQSKQQVLAEKIKWAQQELQQKYQSDVAYQKELEATYRGIEEELAALRKEREALELAVAKGSKSSTAGKSEQDWRTSLLQESTKVAQSIAEETTKISGQRVEILKIIDNNYTVPVGALDQATKAAQTKGKISSPQTIDAGIDTLINSPELATAFTGLTDGQKQALAIHVYSEVQQQIAAVQQGVPMTAEQSERIKKGIEDRYGVPVAEQDAAVLEMSKQASQDEAMKKAGTSLAALKEEYDYIQSQLKPSEEQKKAAAAQKSAAEISSETEMALRTLAINAYGNDGVVSPEEAAKAQELIDLKVSEISGKQPGTPEFEAAKKTLGRTLGFLDPNKLDLENYVLSHNDDTILQTYVREGELKARKEKMGDLSIPKQVAPPTADDVEQRTAELYYPERTQRGFGAVAPFGARENARTRREFEQGQGAPQIGGQAVGGKYPAQPGTVGRGAPAKPQGGQQDQLITQDIMAYTKAAREAIQANSGKFTPETLDGPGSEIYNNISQRYTSGQLKFDDLYAEVSSSTTGNPDMTATLGGADAAKETRDKIMYNVIGSAYEQFLNNQPKSATPGAGMDGTVGEEDSTYYKNKSDMPTPPRAPKERTGRMAKVAGYLQDRGLFTDTGVAGSEWAGEKSKNPYTEE